MHRCPPDGVRRSRRRRLLGQVARPRTLTLVGALACVAAAALPTGSAVDRTAPAKAAVGPVGNGFVVTPADLAFILKQIKISERHSRSLLGTQPGQPANPDVAGDPNYCQALVGPNADQIPDRMTTYGLRTVDGSCNNLFPGRDKFAAADEPFTRLTTPNFRAAEGRPAGFFGPGDPGSASSSYAQKKGTVYDTQPREISNLIVDQTSTNPAAIAAAAFPVRTQSAAGLFPCTTDPDPVAVPPVAGVPAGCVPSHQTLFIPNVTTDVGLSPPYSSLFTFFGQFFDHGVDQTVKSGGTVFVPLKADDPLIAGPDHVFGTADDLPASQRFMVLTRAQNQPGPDGILGDDPATAVDESADDIQDANNTDTPWVDQSQTYTSHSSHQVFLREYELNAAGHPVSTGKLLGGLPADGAYPGSPDGTTGISTWASTKKQAAEKLGLLLVDTDVTNIPMIAADPYGNYLPGPARGLPQYVTKTGVVEGNLAAPVLVPANVVHFDTPFLTDIAHNADPSPQDTDHNPATPPVAPTPDADTTPSADFANQPVGTYDDEMLNAHFACGDGRCNENIALSTIHQIFHSEHDRMVDDIKNTLTNDTSATGVAALAQWKTASNFGDLTADGWNGGRLFQAARFVTEMEYQHLVFEEFARKVQPAVRPFHVYNPDINAAVDAEFAHAVYRFGHSMLDEDVARTSTKADGSKVDNSLPLLTAFLNPPEFYNNSVDPAHPVYTPQEAAGAIVMGSSDQVGNELDEFVTETLRNNLLGLPLDLATINMTRARSEGIPPLNDVRRQIHAQTNDGQLAPYTSWAEFGQHLKHPASLINFVAAYGTHPSITAETTMAGKRAAAKLIVDPADPADPAIPADAADFMFSTPGTTWASDANGVTNTGLDSVDLWVGGLAEVTNLFGGLLGSTFNYVFQNQLEKLQDFDRLYYLARTPGMNLRTQLEGNSFAEMIQRNTDGTNALKADAFGTADCKFQLANLAGTPAGFTSFGSVVADDPSTTDCDESKLLIRLPDGTIKYRQFNTVNPSGINGQSVYQGTDGIDRIFGGNDNDTFWGGLGNDRIEGNGGDDVALGGLGNDIITDLDGADTSKGGPGNDAIDGGPGNDILMGNEGQDFINGGANDNESFAGPGNDFVIAGQGADAVFGDGGDDWIEGGTGQDLLQGDHGAPFFDDPAQVKPGNDIFIGQPGENDYDAEGGDDVMSQNAAVDRNAGAAGFDWAFHQYDTVGGNDDMEINNNLGGLALQVVVNRDRWQETEADSGSKFNDIIKGTSVAPSTIGGAGFSGCDVIDAAGVARIAGLDRLVTSFPTPSAPVAAASAMGFCPVGPNVWGEGDILIGGAGSDTITGRGANDIIDGDHSLNVRISVRTDPANPATEIGSTDLMEHSYQVGNPMTLQQAVFSGIVDPGNLVAGRELKPDMGVTADTATPADCGAAAPVNCDVAVFRNPQSSYTITPNANGSVTVADSTVAATTADGTDTLWNMEVLRFCNNFDRVAKVCLDTVPADVLVSTLGAATPAAASLSAASLAFGSQVVATTSAPQVITVSNTGGAPLTISAVTLTGVNADQFSSTNNCTSVGAGGSCTIIVNFAPTTAGAKTAALSIASNAAGSPSVVNLTGTGTAVATGTTISIAGPTAFGTNRIGAPRTKTVRITNAGPAPVTFTSVSTTGPFTATLGDCATVPSGRTCRLNVTYNPTAPIGAQTGTVNVVSSAANSPTAAIVTGTSRAAVVVVAALRIVQPPAPTALRPVNVSLRVSMAATVRVQVRRANGRLVWSKVTKVSKAGASSVRWNLRDLKGRRVKKGSYRFTITVTDASGARVVVKRSVRVR